MNAPTHLLMSHANPLIGASTQLLKDNPTYAPGAACVGKQVYPFKALQVGQSFAVPLPGAKIKSLRTLIIKYSKPETGKAFAMVIHENAQTIEVGRTK